MAGSSLVANKCTCIPYMKGRNSEHFKSRMRLIIRLDFLKYDTYHIANRMIKMNRHTPKKVTGIDTDHDMNEQ